jgi:hypothetical protein
MSAGTGRPDLTETGEIEANFPSADAGMRDGQMASQLVIRGLDPRIHLEKAFWEDGLPGQARQ